ncbi:hypothetical protein ACFL6M_06165 [Candidatus Eisenbacteria bacterium]|uniref:Uncharacterized protein n=1 Tax=Eiseniibacteriota bacterium TaxID=2212470 RepID=A0ABV6YLF8_UNCEI
MKRLLCLCGVLVFPAHLLSSSPSLADVDDLSNGVFIAHNPPGLQFTDAAPPEGWCQHYYDNFAIHTCEEQNPMLGGEVGDGSVWFVLCAWCEEKMWSGTAFGFESYDQNIFGFIEWDHCCNPGGFCLELTTGPWPGPEAGTTFVTTGGGDWSGNFTPVYYFVGYAYAQGVMPLGPDPHDPLGGWINCAPIPEAFEATCLGAMGIFTDGVECCPEGPTPTEGTTWGLIKSFYH